MSEHDTPTSPLGFKAHVVGRSIYVSTGCGCAMPGIAAALWRERFERMCQAQFEKGRVKPRATKVAKYVETRAPKLGRKLARILKKHAPKIAAKVARAYSKLAKADAPDDATLAALIDGIISSQGLDALASELGVDELVGDLRAALLEQLTEAFRTGAGIGLTEVGVSGEGLPAMTEQLDAKALEYAQARGAELVKDLAGTTMSDLRDVLAGAVEDGTSPADLADALEMIGGFGEARAEMIARTELAFAHVNGNVDGWRETGQVEGKRSILGDLHDDEDQCDECAKAGIVGLEDEFVDGYDFPPYHPCCCLPDTVVAACAVTAHFKRWFEGEVVDISVEGQQLTVTPNHPVLTGRGWVPAGRLQVGDHVFQCSDPAVAVDRLNPHDHHMPTRIDEMTDAAMMALGVSAARVPSATEAFHGDGMPYGEIDVVRPAGALPGRAAQDVEDLSLGLAHGGRAGLDGERASAQLSVGALRPAGSIMSRNGVGGAGLGALLADDQDLLLAHGANRQAVALEELAQRGAVTTEALCEVYAGLAGLVHRVQVVNIERRKFVGHVYNLSTEDGWYFANSIVTHNCVCDVLPVLSEESDGGGDGS